MAVFWILLSLFIMVLSYQLGLGGFNNPGPGLMPLLIGGLLLLISSYHLTTLADTKQKKDLTPNTNIKIDYKRIILVIISLFGYAILLEPLGYLITTCIILILLFRSMEPKWSVVLAGSILAALVTYFGFTQLGVVLPKGILDFLGN
jgi:putative tricarboxylic transport membrane protein